MLRRFSRGGIWTRPQVSARSVRALVQIPIYRHALFLILNTILISGGGFLFWWVAARFGTPANVGLAAAMISSMTFLITVGNLGMGFGLIRFIPGQGDGGCSLIESMTALTITVTLVCAGVFLLGIGVWAPALSLLRDNSLFSGVFVGATVLAAAGTLQDNAFLGKRATQLVVVRNTVLNVVRLACIPFLAAAGAVGIFAAMAAGFAVSFPIAYLVLLPRKLGLKPALGRFSLPLLSRVLPYSLGNLVSDLIVIAPSVFLPLVILHVLGAAATGFFYIAWLANGLLMIIPGGFAQALLAEGSHSEGDLRSHLRQAARGIGFLIGVFVVGTVIVAPWALALFGRAYAVEGTALLRWFAVAALPASVTALAFTVMRVRRRIGVVIGGQACLAASALVLAWSFSHAEGLVGVGVAWLLANMLCALLVAPVALRYVRAGQPSGSHPLAR